MNWSPLSNLVAFIVAGLVLLFIWTVFVAPHVH